MFKYPLFKTYYSSQLDSVISSVLQSGAVASGKYIKEFENGLGDLLGEQFVVSTSNMSAAMYIALYLSGVGKGDEVLTTAFTCMSSNSPINNIGAIPVWVDLFPGSFHMDPALLERAITEKTKAVILYHTAGYPANSKAISEICKRHGITLIEDCNNAFLSSNRDGLSGSYGDFSIHSFYPNRLINTIEGGALICKHQDDYERALKLRRFGVDSATFRNAIGEINPQSNIAEIGWSMNLPNLNCAMGSVQLSDVNDRLAAIQSNASCIDSYLDQMQGVTRPQLQEKDEPAYWVYLLQVEQRDLFIKKLKEAGVHASSLHHRNDIYSGFNAKASSLPVTDEVQSTILALPVGWWLTKNDIITMMDIFSKVKEKLDD
ncbi:DegT/DnrJ/EryC1/StrS family aminotransferase [Cedecea sp.]|jgi:dTDP-4-amino-4,6-dideoxygalactose transaminase|uniref:DegT/DnrJ/EryC1/StrS family aminotransferase n=1 Tax=Cedecea sp. TaxID=1970739 RepID=UPI002F418F1C